MASRKDAFELMRNIDNTTKKKTNTSVKTTPAKTTTKLNDSYVPTSTSNRASMRNSAFEIMSMMEGKQTRREPSNISNDYRSAPDFTKYSRIGADLYNPSYEDAKGLFSIAGREIGGKKVGNKVTYSRANAPQLALDGTTKTGDPKYSKMSEDEVNIYNYLLAKNGDKEADKYLESIDRELNYRYTNDIAVGVKESSDKHKLLGTAMNLSSSMFTPVAYLETAKQTAKNKITGKNEKSDPYSGAFGPVNIEQATREGLKEDTGKVGDFLWDTGISMGQFLTKLPFGQTAALAIMGSGAAGQTAKDVLDRGGSQDKAMLSGTISGAAEIVFEKISMDQLKYFKANPTKDLGSLVKNVLKGSFTEGSEEVLTEISNEIADNIIMGDLSNYSLNVQEYIRQGLSKEEAEKKARQDFAKQVGLAFAGGALSGGVMSAGANVIGNYQTGRELNQMGIAQEVINEGLASQPNTTSNQLANKLQQQVTNNQRVGNFTLANQYNANIEAIENEELQQNSNIQNSNVQEPIEMESREATVNQPVLSNDVNINRPIQKPVEANIPNKAIEPIKTEQANVSTSKQTNVLKSANIEVTEPISKAIATFNNSDSPITVKGISSVSENNVNVIIDDGNTETVANINDLNFSNPTTAKVYANSSNFGSNGAKAYITGYNNKYSLNDYTNGFQRYYNLGKTNFPMDKINSVYASILPKSILDTAYYSGMNDTNETTESKQQKVDEVKADNKANTNNKSGIVENETSNNMDEDTKFLLHVLGRKSNVSIVMENDIDGANGYYKDGEIHISNKADNPSLVVYAHELTHYMEDASPKLWKEYRDYVINYMQSEHIEQYNSLVEHTKNLYRENGLDITDDGIMNEIAANATEEFLTDANAIEKLANENKSLADKIIDILNSFIDKIKDMFKDYSTTSTEGKMLRSNLDVLENARKLWLNALDGTTVRDTSDTKKVASIKEKFSLKDSEGRELSKEQQEFFKDSKARDEKGNLLVLYHGTNNDFNIFDANNTKEGNGAIWLSENIDYAEELAYVKNGNRIIESYVNVTHPLIVTLKPNEFSDPMAEKPYINKAKENGNDGVVFKADTDNPILQDTFYAVFEPNQIKRVSNLKPTHNEDIRFSLKDTSDVDVKALTEENIQYKDATDLLSEQLDLLKNYSPDEKTINKLATEILKEYNSNYDKSTLVENLNNLFDYISKSEVKMYDDALEVTTGMAKNMLENSESLNYTLSEQYSDLRMRLRTNGISLSDEAKKEIAYHYGSYNNFRKQYFGRIKLTNDGINLDNMWGELSSQYPELFDV